MFDPEFRKVAEEDIGLAGLDVIGGDVQEIAPQYDATTNIAHVGAQMLFEILALMTASHDWQAQE